MVRPFHRWFQALSRQQQAFPKARKNRVRPQLEVLEDRLAPAVFTVNSLLDLSMAGGVNPDGTIIGHGNSVTLRSAIQAANGNSGAGGNIINLALPGTYRLTLAGPVGETDNLQGELSIFPTFPNGNLTINNISGGTVIVDGNHLNRVFDINASDTNNPGPKFLVAMQGFVITNGDASDSSDGPGSTGGGIRDQGNTSLTLTNMVITDNVANADGGGVVMENSANSTWMLTVNNSTISNNHAGDAGGGIDTDGAGTVTINPGTIISGNTDVNQGAGVYIDAIQVGTIFVSASMTMTETIVSDNQAINTGITASGGGISNAGNGTMTIVASTVAGNFSGGMGGGFSDENNVGTLVISSSVFRDNSAVGSGGGIQEGGPSTSITQTLIQGNTSSATGGSLFLNGTAVSIQDSTIVNNTALGGGGGVEIETTGTGTSGTTITNSTLTANSVTANAAAANTANGGGIEAPATTFTGSLTLLNDTINGNYASAGGGIFWGGTTGSFALQNTIVASNSAGTAPDANNPAGSFTDNGGNLIGISGAGSGNTGFAVGSTQTGTTATPLNPQLAPLADYGGPLVGAPSNQVTLPTEALEPGSPALDAGVASGAPATDERGFARPDQTTAGARPDMGAYETQDLSGNRAFVASLYRDFLHRLGDVTNLNDAGSWVNALDFGGQTRQQVATSIARSAEALGVLVDGLYNRLLGRAPDPAGRASFVSFLQGGGTEEQAILTLVTSPEYQASNGGVSDSEYVDSLYMNLLGRTGSNAEVAGWVAMIPTIGRAGVAREFLASTEYSTYEIQQLYGNPLAPVLSVASVAISDLLHRSAPVSTAEVNSWLNSGKDILTIETLFAGGMEYFNLASTLTGGVFV
jgi:hypothetical protein